MKYIMNHVNDETNRCLCKKCREARQQEKAIEKECLTLNNKIDSGELTQDLSRATEMAKRKQILENKNIWS